MQISRCRWQGAFIAAAFFAAPASAQQLEVIEYTCAKAVRDASPVDIVDCAGTNLPGPVYLWVRVKGGEDALAVLEKGGRLVVRHKWRRRAARQIDIETVTAEEEIGAGAITPDVLSELRLEFEERGYFDWRTWTVKHNLRATRYGVDVIDQRFEKLACTAAAQDSESCIDVFVRE